PPTRVDQGGRSVEGGASTRPRRESSPMTSEIRWERLTAPELKALAARDALVVLPVGSLEQHGPHLPVWTDSFIAHALACRAAEEARDVPAVVLPPIWTGLSEHHFPFGGTISVDYATFHA